MGWRRAVSITIERWHPGLRRRRDQHGVLRHRGQRRRPDRVARLCRGADRPGQERALLHARLQGVSLDHSSARREHLRQSPSPTRSRASSGTTSPPSPDHDYTYVFHPLAGTPKNLDRSRPDGLDRRPDRAALRRGARRVLQPRRRLEPGVRAGVRQHVAQRPAVAAQAPEGPAVAEPGPRRGDARVHHERPPRRCDPRMLLRVHLSAGAGGAGQGHRPTAWTCSSSSTARSTSTPSNEKQPDGTVKAVFFESDPRLRNLAAIADAGLPASAVIRREARRSDLAHNKFMVLLDGRPANPAQVWTGSTNLTEGGIHGQANVGHWIRDAGTAARFGEYWKLLATDPGGRQGDSQSTVRARNKEFYDQRGSSHPDPDPRRDPTGITPVFSPRTGLAPLRAVCVAAGHGEGPGLHHLRVHGPGPVQGRALRQLQQRTTAAFCCWRRRIGPNRGQPNPSFGWTPTTTCTRPRDRNCRPPSASGWSRPTPGSSG